VIVLVLDVIALPREAKAGFSLEATVNIAIDAQSGDSGSEAQDCFVFTVRTRK
jgi:hypothetical protein